MNFRGTFEVSVNYSGSMSELLGKQSITIMKVCLNYFESISDQSWTHPRTIPERSQICSELLRKYPKTTLESLWKYPRAALEYSQNHYGSIAEVFKKLPTTALEIACKPELQSWKYPKKKAESISGISWRHSKIMLAAFHNSELRW